jgi:hypothetical protein
LITYVGVTPTVLFCYFFHGFLSLEPIGLIFNFNSEFMRNIVKLYSPTHLKNLATLNESIHNELLGGALIFGGRIFLLNFFTILTDLSTLNIHFVNPNGDDDA